MPSTDAVEKLNFRRDHLLSALRSERIQVLVGESKKEFQVPKDLLTKCSSVFHAMCNPPFKESIDGVIELPEINPSIFGGFMIWLHSCPPAIPEDDDDQAIIDLAIFADTYQIFPLKNQTSDLIHRCLLRDADLIRPATMIKIYESTPDGSMLQELFSLAFVRHQQSLTLDALSEWEDVFGQFPTFGRDYFRHNLRRQRGQSIQFQSLRTCRFHDHANMTGYDRDSAKGSWPCQYPDGGDWIENERELQNKRKREQELAEKKG